jgi:hypothetical protein
MNAKDDLNDLNLDGNLDVNRGLHRNDPLADLNLDVKTGENRDRRMNDLLDDLNLVAKMDVSRGLRKNVMDDPSLGVNLLNRNCVRHDLNLVVMTDVNLCLRMNDLLAGHLMDGSHVNRNCVRHDLKMGGNSDVMNHHVKLMVFPNTNCDRMSHDHLRYDRQMMRHHDTSRMDEMNLDEKMKIHHVSWC